MTSDLQAAALRSTKPLPFVSVDATVTFKSLKGARGQEGCQPTDQINELAHKTSARGKVETQRVMLLLRVDECTSQQDELPIAEALCRTYESGGFDFFQDKLNHVDANQDKPGNDDQSDEAYVTVATAFCTEIHAHVSELLSAASVRQILVFENHLFSILGGRGGRSDGAGSCGGLGLGGANSIDDYEHEVLLGYRVDSEPFLVSMDYRHDAKAVARLLEAQHGLSRDSTKELEEGLRARATALFPQSLNTSQDQDRPQGQRGMEQGNRIFKQQYLYDDDDNQSRKYLESSRLEQKRLEWPVVLGSSSGAEKSGSDVTATPLFMAAGGAAVIAHRKSRAARKLGYLAEKKKKKSRQSKEKEKRVDLS
eukprot:CAMPEP_0171686658 /NCGR_PEP_ID=MMETSP0991-20121206/2923_1 /TAXON_ID=483369 /ORGANISM="non described non described, Strain CCMP2098" /LENGTH=366 /DNA_ID=CAMNT_0012274435 /DNA_START=191 /DNA_END=1292 /DNA_ORIENTATION=-